MTATTAQRPWYRRSSSWWRILRDGGSIALAVWLIVWGLPRVAGVTWTEIFEPLSEINPLALVLAAAMQVTALLAFTFTVTGSLPGISHRRALTVNLAGSLVANTLPFGGALAVGASYGICRSWGFRRSAIGISLVLGGVFSTAGKILLPLVGLGMLVVEGEHVTAALRDAAVAGVLTLVAILVVIITVIASDRAAHVIGRAVERTAEWLLRIVRRPRVLGWEASVAGLRTQTHSVLGRGWLPMTFGTLGYFAVYLALYWYCLWLCGVTTSAAAIMASYALGRLLTSAGVTPGGVGLVEAGSVAMLVAMGADPAAAASGVLLFMIFTTVLEIPLGVLAWLAWVWGRRRSGTPTAQLVGRALHAEDHGSALEDAMSEPAAGVDPTEAQSVAKTSR